MVGGRGRKFVEVGAIPWWGELEGVVGWGGFGTRVFLCFSSDVFVAEALIFGEKGVVLFCY
jgi:hypothetical protein